MDKVVLDRISGLWHILYGKSEVEKFTRFINMVDQVKQTFALAPQPQGWYKDAVIYAAYVDLFNHTFNGLNEKLDHLHDLGVTCLWLLPVLDSPMRDAGFDIRDYRNIRAELFGLPADTPAEVKQAEFRKFLDNAHNHGIKVIFDIAMNHTSEEHPWFVESRKGPENPFRDYYIWNKDTNLYKETRLLFKGMVPSNWEKDGEWYFFHRFFEFQPDLNYRNPDVLTEITAILLFWLQQGLDGFRADAIPYLWKEDGTDCENLPQTHTILKIFRAVLDYIRPNTLLLAEACQPPKEVVKYFGNNDECHAGYHFPLMPMIFKSLAISNPEPVETILHPETTPPIGPENQWFMFLRLHDELTLEMVTPEDRAIIHGHYCMKPEWDFRVGEGISARLAELLDRNPQKIALAYSIMLSLPGTPIIYYGDEFARLNDEEFFRMYMEKTGKEDSRYLVRGYLNWDHIKEELEDKNSLSFKVLNSIRKMIEIRSQHPEFSRGDIRWIKLESVEYRKTLSYQRSFGEKKVTVINNLSNYRVVIGKEISNGSVVNLLTGSPVNFPFTLEPYEFIWIA
ncbi:MAG TPA: alpha-amylase family glycosyl hydrolase [Lentimicrobium sp.]|nr:alpha-amylase family glycosyl hydrolase [Lentimicrobium sp.]